MDKTGAHNIAFANDATALDVLRNPRNGIEIRKAALTRISQNGFVHNSESCKVLQDLIRFEDKLRYGAFKKLLDILPDDYVKQGYPVDLKTTIKHIVNSDVRMEDVEMLVRKDKTGSLAPIIAMALYRICTKREDLGSAMAILRNIFNMKEYRHVLGYEQIFMLFNFAAQTSDKVYKKNLSTIMERNIHDHEKSSYDRQLKGLNLSMSADFVDKKHAREIKEIIESGIRLIDDKIIHLVKSLNSDPFGEELLELLVTVQNKQGLSETVQKKFFKKLIISPSLLIYRPTCEILSNIIKSKFSVPDKIIQMAIQHVSDDNLAQGVFQLVKYSIYTSSDLIYSAEQILFDSKKLVKLRIAAAQYLAEVAEVNCGYERLALENVDSWQQFELCIAAFKCFVKVQDEISESFVIGYYENMKNCILSNKDDNIEEDDLEKLDDFIIDSSVLTNDKLLLLNTLGDVYSINKKRLSQILHKQNLDIKVIDIGVFESYDPVLWRRELLCGALIFSTTLEQCVIEENYDFYFENFIRCVNELKISLRGECTIECVLAKLVTKQSILRLNIKQVIDILIVLKCPTVIEAFLSQPPEFVFDILTMKKKWISYFLEKRGIENNEGEEDYHKDLILMLSLVLVESLLSKITDRIDFDNLTEIIKILHNCNANSETKENFLNHCLAENSSFSVWKMKLCFFSVENSLEYKTKNAYNQAQNRYKYKFEDMRIIGSQLIEKYPFKLVFVLEIKHLNAAISSSRNDKDVLFIINISECHWVVMVITKYGKEMIALYKDSFGESFETERKKIESKVKDNFSNIKFIFHENQEQYDEFSGAIFALKNLDIMAKNMIENPKKFVEEFKEISFASETVADAMRKTVFPKLYAKGCSINYQQYGNIEVPTSRNAYNQAKLPYKYNLEDITTIASQLMKYHVDDFKLIVVLRLEDLGRAVRTFEEEKKELLVLLKVSTDHWVTLAILKVEEGILVLYKDSLGAEEFEFERNQAEVLLKERMPRLKMVYHKSQDQLDDFSGAVFALSNLKNIAENVVENREYFLKNFENWTFATQTEANKNRVDTFPKHYAVSYCAQYKKFDLIKHHHVELLALKDILKSKLKKYTVTIDGEKVAVPNIVISIEEDYLYDNSYKYSYSITIEQKDFMYDDQLKDAIVQALGSKSVNFKTKTKILIASQDVPIKKRRNMNMKLYNANMTNARTIDILKRLNIKPDEFNKKRIEECFKQVSGYKIFNSDLVVYDMPEDNDVDSMIKGKLFGRLHKEVKKLFKLGWVFESVVDLIGSINTECYMKTLQDCVVIIWEYKLREYDSDALGRRLIDILRDRTVKNLEKLVHELAIHRTFWGSSQKSLSELERETIHLNKSGNITDHQCKRAVDAYQNIIKSYHEKSELFPAFESISKWDSDLIGQWSREVQADKMSVSQHEKLAVIIRAVEVAHGLKPRDIQMLSLIFLISGQSDKGRVAEINTGEGKTVIIAMIAALQALDGHKVDVITSSPELSLPQAEEQKKFYDLLNLRSAAFSKSSKKDENVLYGFVNEFQAESLQNEVFSNEIFSQLSKIGRRPYDIAIVDEVDSMLIDDRYHILKLSIPVPGMGSLQSCLAAVWLQIGSVASCIVEQGGQAYYLESQGSVDDDGIATASLEKVGVPINCTKSEFITNCTEIHIRKVLRDISHLSKEDKEIEKGYPEIFVPKHLRDLVTDVQIPKWIESCITGKFWLELNKHYVIKDNDKVVPVDAYNTGVVQESMYWSNGLHQFLQIKHGAKLTPESLTSNYVSNVSFFKNYGKNLYGLTGTVGNQRTKDLLSNTYGVDDISIPPFKHKQYRELTPIIMIDKKAWLNLIVRNSMQKLRNGRAILIIVRFIADTEELAEMFKESGHESKNVKLYKTNEDSSAVRETLESNQVIITTNISGRGTDIKVSEEVELNGGLHVCLTFIPLNSRVQQQNLGRTSRMGLRGTGQFILHDEKGRPLNKLLAERDEEHERSLRQAENEIKRVLVKDIVFDRFCQLLRELERNGLNKTESEAVKERFGIWLKVGESNYDYESEKHVMKEFEKFEAQLKSDQSTRDCIKNPFYFLRDGVAELKDNRFKDAIWHFDRAIEKDSRFAENAFYGRACAKVAVYGGRLSKNLATITSAINDYKEARSIFEERERELQFIQRCSTSTVFSEQIAHKMNLIDLQQRAIDCAIGVDVDKLKGQIESMETTKTNRTDLKDDDKNKIAESIKNLQEQIDTNGDGGVLGKALKSKNNVEITFIDINESLPSEDIALYKDELKEFNINGFVGEFIIKEIKPIPWGAVFAMFFIGLVQIIVGAALVVFSVGAAASFGAGLISEGIGDIVTAVKDGIINRDFSWESWGIQKAISFTVSLVCAGMQAIKNFVKTAYYGVKSAVSSAATGITQSVKEGWKLAAKKVGIQLAKGVAKELVNGLADYGVDNLLIPKIQEAIAEKVEAPIQRALLKNKLVKKMLELDGKNRNRYFENAIENLATKILDPEKDHAVFTLIKGITQGIADNKLKGFSAARQVTEALVALGEISTFVPMFIKRLEDAIQKLAIENGLLEEEKKGEENGAEDKETTKVIDKDKKDSQEKTDISTEEIEDELIPDENLQAASILIDAPSNVGKGDLDLNKNEDLQQVDFGANKKSSKTLGVFLAKKVSKNISVIVKGKLIQPFTKAVVNYGIDKLSLDVEKTVEDQITNYRAERRILFSQTKTEKGRFDDNYHDIHKDPTAKKTAEDIIVDLSSNGEAGLVHLGAVSDTIERPIQVLDEKGRLKYTIGTDKEGTPIKVQYSEPCDSNPQGHWTLPGGKEPVNFTGGTNDCLFNVIAEQTGTDPTKLRENTVESMKNNWHILANQAVDFKILYSYKKTALCLGGAGYSGKKPEDAGQILDNSQGVSGEYFTALGHPRGHASDPSATSSIGSVENYSHTGLKTGFTSRIEQDTLTHYALLTPIAQQSMQRLNNGSKREVVTIPISSLNLPSVSNAMEWHQGKVVNAPFQSSSVTLVLQHHQGKQNDASAPVHVHTVYPRK